METADDTEAARNDRKAGFVLLACAAVLGYLGIVRPLRAAERGEEVQLFLKAALLVPFCLVYGGAFAFFRDGARDLFGTRTKPTPFGWVTIVVLVALGLGLYVWIEADLSHRGYR